MWGMPNYQGTRVIADGTDSLQGLPFNFNSAKNRFDNRKLTLLRCGPKCVETTKVACLDPDENRPDPGWFEAYSVSGVGGRCP